MPNWTPLLLLALILNLILGCNCSRATALSRVNLVGVRESERERLRTVFEPVRGRPALSIVSSDIEERFAAQGRVKTAKFTKSLLGFGTLTLTYRKPMLQFSGMDRVLVDEAGVVFHDPEFNGKIMQLKLGPSVKVTTATLAGAVDLQALVKLSTELQKQFNPVAFPPETLQIEVEDDGSISLNLSDGKVVFGSSDQIDEKVALLSQWLEQEPMLFDKLEEVNLMAASGLPQGKPRRASARRGTNVKRPESNKPRS